jgi:hypothetical protein
MYLRPELLRANLESLDSEAILAKVQSGAMTKEACAIAQEVLASRGMSSVAPSEAVPLALRVPGSIREHANLPGQHLLPWIIGIYAAFLLLCTFVVLSDPPWNRPRNGTWEGAIGTFAAFAAGAPWTFLFAGVPGVAANTTLFLALSWVGVIINFAFLLAYQRRT